MRIFYQTNDGNIDPESVVCVEDGSMEEELVGEDYGSSCDDRTNMGAFDGFLHLIPEYAILYCKAYLKHMAKFYPEATTHIDSEVTE
jgi:hypothetical protein